MDGIRQSSLLDQVILLWQQIFIQTALPVMHPRADTTLFQARFLIPLKRLKLSSPKSLLKAHF